VADEGIAPRHGRGEPDDRDEAVVDRRQQMM
jgi:hypothetical protein